MFYQPCKDFATFIFAVYHFRKSEEDESETYDKRKLKKSYIIVRKSHRDMDIIFRGNKPIIEEEDQVQIIKAWDHVCTIKFMDISRYQFENIAEIEFLSAKNTEQTKEYKYQHREIKLYFCKEVDQKAFINFIPFIYQEWNSMLTNKLIIYDIYTKLISESESINPS